MLNNEIEKHKTDLGKVALVLLGFAILFLGTGFVLSTTSDVTKGNYQLNDSIGPLEVTSDYTVYNIDVQGYLEDKSWLYLELVLQNSQKEYLFSFGKELWRESGYDSDGAWSESESHFSQKITIPKKGTYFLAITGGSSTNRGSMKVNITEQAASALPHMWIGVLLLIIGIILNEIKNRTLLSMAGYERKEH
ncbi:hypothetical protein [Kiloniella sp. EL199]|uniref:hypothetical protein n=1 Tax=Kiloniella sp. EL199 TaxID=2107581 RepID=UPI000EA08479|nr:hypothetical protein [Kiloniella sp. EL199]